MDNTRRSLNRKCGSCSECCYVLSVGEGILIEETQDSESDTNERILVKDVAPDVAIKALHHVGYQISSFNKPKYEKCQHQKFGSRSCGIYPTRPQACQKYTCAWLEGLGSSSDRPDESGVVFTYEETILGPTLLGLESRAGQATRHNSIVLKALEVANRANIAVIVGGKEKRTILRVPPGKEHKAQMALMEAKKANLNLDRG